MPESLTTRLAELDRQLALLPEAHEPPPTTLQILGRNTVEQDWQRLLFHFLTPEESHGLDHALLEHLLGALADRDDLDFGFSRFDLDEIGIEMEVTMSNDRRPDAVVWSSEEWFLCWELKVGAPESEDQTRAYVDARSFRSVGLTKGDVPAEGHHYVYLAPGDVLPSDCGPADDGPPEAEEFVPVSWEWIAAQIESFLVETHGEYPARTTAQLSEFAATIRSELTMTQFEENQQEKVELYLDYYDEISDVQGAFDDAWESLTRNWGLDLAELLDTAELVADEAVPEEYASVGVTMANGEQRLWTFQQGRSDWNWLFPREWWTTLDDGEPFFDSASPDGRVGFLHRLGRNRERAVRDRELVFYLRNAPASHDTFYDGFADRFRADEEIPGLLPPTTERTGRKSNVLEATYDIEVTGRGDFFEAYLDALARAFREHVVERPALVERVDHLYRETVDKDTPF